MASDGKYAKGILINLGFMSVWCAVQIYFQEAFWKSIPTVLYLRETSHF